MTDINELKQGDVVRLLGFGSTPTHYRQKLLSLGITRGIEFQVVRKAPLGCPLQIEVRGTSLALRKEDASFLLLERV
jgi:ferrous iron transport protein A